MKKVKISKKWVWINIFLRDSFLALLMVYVNYRAHFNSWWAAFILGMIVVLTSWHFTDFLNYRRSLQDVRL